ncbi:MAG: histidine phosphatase family protein [Alphaproteobacteria bacterium]|nr:histidine phosphatase family protein [Alphaproteobacteria bacterium]MDP6567799.1 histidine phosphatase family protein [Alphaproteobacteria bacterium]MDP6813858.1 histidine phosphatase family protein [Alphaproteobacteria bacterium]
MSRKQLYLIRHGHTVWNGPPHRIQGQMDSSLSEAGRAAAVALGRRMKQPDRVVSSPALRCRQTVDCLFGRRPDAIEPRCLEIDLGWFEGLLATEIMDRDAAAWQGWLERPWEGAPWGGESLAELQARVVAGVGEILAGVGPGERVFVAAHGGVLRTLICYVNDLPLEHYPEIEMDNLTLVELAADQVRRGGHDIRRIGPEDML